ncbi:beta-lactamase-like protein [Kalaharituber pfeilii]|nr:beta-lactamase-like protein [Kalaharituber pfeilii]
MKVTAQVVTTPSVDTHGTTILISLETKRYLIGNAGEGLQRAMLQTKVKTAKVTDVFLTGTTEWKNVGGLLGLILTQADQEAAKKADYDTKRLEVIERVRAFAEGRGDGGTAPQIPELFEKKELNVHGNDNLMHTMGTTRSYVFRTSMTINFNEIKEDFVDKFLRVHPMKVYPEGFIVNPMDTIASTDLTGLYLSRGRKRSFDGHFKSPKTREQVLKSVVQDMFNSSWTMDSTMMEDEIPPHDDTPAVPAGPPKRVRAPWPASMIQRLPRSKPSPASLSYFVSLHPQRGRFLPEIAKSLGVQPGPDFRKLTEGQSVTTDSGRVVTPQECLEPQKPGKSIIILDIPDTSYVAPLLAREELQDDNIEATVYWMLGKGVASDERVWGKIKRWANTVNIVSSPELCPNSITLQGAAKAATRLNLLHPDHFPIPKYDTKPIMSPPEVPGTLYVARPQQQITILPKLSNDQLSLPLTLEDGNFDIEGVRTTVDPEYMKLAEQARQSVLQEEQTKGLEDLPGKEVEIITIGTGSAMPSKYRNVSATLLRIPGVGSILFDCGEGTLGQLSRLYGLDELQDVLRDIKCIYISHLHADHHLGTTAVLKAWYKAKHDGMPAPAIATPMMPYGLSHWKKYNGLLGEYSDVEDFGDSWIKFLATDQIRIGEGDTLQHLESLYRALSLSEIQTAKANHCIGASTCAFTFQDGFKFAYSGDTRPTQEFVRIGQGATLLLHEATFDDELSAEAVAKKHSTTSEAIKAGIDMGAKVLMLTHFSQRYPKLPVIAEEGHGAQKMKVALAFDMMRMKVGEIGRFEKFIPALRELYKDEGEEEDPVMIVEDPEQLKVKNKKSEGKKEKKDKKEKKEKEKEKQAKKESRKLESAERGLYEGEKAAPTHEPSSPTSPRKTLPGYF